MDFAESSSLKLLQSQHKSKEFVLSFALLLYICPQQVTPFWIPVSCLSILGWVRH